MLGRVIRTIAVIGITGILLALIIFNVTNKPPIADKVWDLRTTMGDSKTATRHYIMYTDVMCPYCDVFSRAIMENEAEFRQDYLEAKHILFELRMTDFLYEYGHNIEYSRQGAEAIYCATEQDRFWDYYHGVLKKLWNDYHSKGIGTSKTAPKIEDITDEYWLSLGAELELGEEFAECYNSHAMVEKIEANTAKAAQVVGGGVPFFQFEKFVSGDGFHQSWGWKEVKRYLDAGL